MCYHAVVREAEGGVVRVRGTVVPGGGGGRGARGFREVPREVVGEPGGGGAEGVPVRGGAERGVADDP